MSQQIEAPEFFIVKGYAPKGAGFFPPPDKYSVDYFKGGECILSDARVANIQLAKTNGDSLIESGPAPYPRRANAMRVYMLDKRGWRAAEFGLYQSTGKGGWRKVSHPKSTSYGREVLRVLEAS